MKFGTVKNEKAVRHMPPITVPAAADTKQVEFRDKTVAQDNSTFDPNAVGDDGLTNIERMQEGLAPLGHDGKPVNIHHIDQTNDGPVMEISATDHQQNYNELHQNTGQSPSEIDRSAFNIWRRNYWKSRANDLLGN